MKKLTSLLLFIPLLFAACKSNSTDGTKEQNDSLLLANAENAKKLNACFELINEIDANFEKIREAENYMAVRVSGEEIDDDVRERINENMLLISNLLQKNKEQIAKLEKEMQRNGVQMKEMQKTIERLNNMLYDKTQIVEQLQADLARRDSTIMQLDDEIRLLNQNMDNVKEENAQKTEIISSQDEAIHTAWYVFGSRKELKEQKIITSDGLFSPAKVLQQDFNKNYFVKIDTRNVKRIPLYSSRAKILTTHPKASYEIEKSVDNLFLQINNPAEFWSISKYLVVEVD